MRGSEDKIWVYVKVGGKAGTVKVKRNAGIFHRASGMQRNQEASWRIAPSSNHNTELPANKCLPVSCVHSKFKLWMCFQRSEEDPAVSWQFMNLSTVDILNLNPVFISTSTQRRRYRGVLYEASTQTNRQNTKAAVDIRGNIKLQYAKCLCRHLAWMYVTLSQRKSCRCPLLYFQIRTCSGVWSYRGNVSTRRCF